MLRYLSRIGLDDGDAERKTEAVWFHALATGYAPGYLHENADAIHLDWPRIPLPNTLETLLVSAELGQQVAALLEVGSPVDQITVGHISL